MREHFDIWRFLPHTQPKTSASALPLPIAALIVTVGVLLVALTAVFFIAFTTSAHANPSDTQHTVIALGPHARRWT